MRSGTGRLICALAGRPSLPGREVSSASPTMDRTRPSPRRRARHAFSKVPEVTAYFWIVKALTTAMGESTSDFLVHTMVPQIAVVLGGIALVVALYIQFAQGPLRPLGLLAGGGDGRRLRHDGRRRPARRLRRPLHRLDDLLRARARSGLPALVRQRGHPLDPQHHARRAASSSTGRRSSPPSPSAPPPAT